MGLEGTNFRLGVVGFTGALGGTFFKPTMNSMELRMYVSDRTVSIRRAAGSLSFSTEATVNSCSLFIRMRSAWQQKGSLSREVSTIASSAKSSFWMATDTSPVWSVERTAWMNREAVRGWFLGLEKMFDSHESRFTGVLGLCTFDMLTCMCRYADDKTGWRLWREIEVTRNRVDPAGECRRVDPHGPLVTCNVYKELGWRNQD